MAKQSHTALTTIPITQASAGRNSGSGSGGNSAFIFPIHRRHHQHQPARPHTTSTSTPTPTVPPLSPFSQHPSFFPPLQSPTVVSAAYGSGVASGEGLVEEVIFHPQEDYFEKGRCAD